MSSVQANFMIPEELLSALRALVPRGKQSEVVAHALKNELKRIQYKRALKYSFGAWKKEAHPELDGGIEGFIRNQRTSKRVKRTGI